jgi:hypothetical protein
MMAQSEKNIKPTVGFSARFFLEGLDRRLSLKGNGLRAKKSQENRKTRKKVLNISMESSVLLPNKANFTGRDLQVALVARVIWHRSHVRGGKDMSHAEAQGAQRHLAKKRPSGSPTLSVECRGKDLALLVHLPIREICEIRGPSSVLILVARAPRVSRPILIP